jgi:hypothetical protein
MHLEARTGVDRVHGRIHFGVACAHRVNLAVVFREPAAASRPSSTWQCRAPPWQGHGGKLLKAQHHAQQQGPGTLPAGLRADRGASVDVRSVSG